METPEKVKTKAAALPERNRISPPAHGHCFLALEAGNWQRQEIPEKENLSGSETYSF
jgi:hypothetical protein